MTGWREGSLRQVAGESRLLTWAPARLGAAHMDHGVGLVLGSHPVAMRLGLARWAGGASLSPPTKLQELAPSAGVCLLGTGYTVSHGARPDVLSGSRKVGPASDARGQGVT